MTPRIQFRTTDDEYASIERNAADAGFSSITQFVKELALAYPNPLQTTNNEFSFAEIFEEVKKAVKKKVDEVLSNHDTNPRFVLREITPRWHEIPQHENVAQRTIPKPLRASVGKHFFSEVKKGNFPNVRYTEKVDKYGTAIYVVNKEN